MHFHIGNRDIVSKESIIGIFTRESILDSGINDKYATTVFDDTKSIIVDTKNNVFSSIVTTNTLIERFNSVQYDDCLYKRSGK